MSYEKTPQPSPRSTPLPEPGMYEVVALRDEFTPSTFVSAVLVEIFGLPKSSARKLTQQLQDRGSVCLGVFSHEIADTKASIANDVARHEGHPLTLILKPN